MNNVLIIGAGSIGALKPDKYDSPTTENILTHAHAAKAHKDFKLWAIMDNDLNKKDQARYKWECVGVGGFEFFNSGSDDIHVIVIATPTETHEHVYNEIVNRSFPNLKAIVIEKPCGDNVKECTDMMGDDRIIVNYTRRFIPEYKQLKNNFKNQEILSCLVHYVRGVKRDSCHAINLVNYFFGEIQEVKLLSKGIDDYSKEDTSDCFWIKTEQCPNIIFLPGDGRIADHFDIQIMTNKGMYCLYNHGSTIYKRMIEKEKIYGDYMSLQGQIYDFTHINFKKRLLMNLYDNVLAFINGAENPCPIKEAIEVHQVIEKLRKDNS